MNPLYAAAQDAADMLAAAGVHTVTDPRDIEPPCAWVSPSRIAYPTLAGRPRTVEWEVYLIAPDSGVPLFHLGDLIDRAATVFPGIEARTLGLTIPNLSPDPLPAITFTIETETD